MMENFLDLVGRRLPPSAADDTAVSPMVAGRAEAERPASSLREAPGFARRATVRRHFAEAVSSGSLVSTRLHRA